MAGLVSVGAAAAQTPVERGAVQTMAGPGFCSDRTVIEKSADRIGALAVDADGWIFSDLVDAREPGVIRAYDGTRMVLLTSGEPASRPSDPIASARERPGPSRLASAGKGSVVVAAGPRLIQLDSNPVARRAIAGDGAPATGALLTSARSVAADEQRNLYIADQVSPSDARFVIRFMNRGDSPVTFYAGTPDELAVAPGQIATIAGADGTPAGPEGRALHASLQGVPPSLAVRGSRLYVASYWNRAPLASTTVQLVNLGDAPLSAHGVAVAAGGIATVAGGGARPSEADGADADARSVALSYVTGIAVDDQGVYLAEPDRNRVSLIAESGRLSLFAGAAGPRDPLGAELDRPAVGASLDRPVDVKVAPGRRVLISEEGTGRLLLVDRSGALHLAVGASHPTRCALPQPGSATEERPTYGGPYSVVPGADGHTYFVNLDGRTVQAVDAQGTSSLLAAPPVACRFADRCAPVLLPDESWPVAAARKDNTLFLLDLFGRRVFTLDVTRRGPVETVATLPPPDTPVDPRHAPSSRLLTEDPIGDIALAPDGTIFVADSLTGTVWRVDATGAATAIAGSAGPAEPPACCTKPTGLTTDRFGNLYVSDLATRQVWFLNRGPVAVRAHGQDIAAGQAAPILGTGRRGIGGDGLGTEVPAYQPTGLVTDDTGNLYIAEYRDESIRRLDPAGHVTTVAGIGTGGFNGDGLPARQTALHSPTDVAFDRCGNLVVADFGNDRVRRIDIRGECPPVPSRATPSQSSNATPLLLALGALLVAAGVLVFRRRAGRHRVTGSRA